MNYYELENFGGSGIMTQHIHILLPIDLNASEVACICRADPKARPKSTGARGLEFFGGEISITSSYKYYY